jgi:hypothetical protein
METAQQQEPISYKIEPLHLFWTRGKAELRYNIPQVMYAEGVRGSGKSVLIEHIGMNYLSYGCAVFDVFGSVTGEGLAWLRAPFIKDLNVLLLKGENVDVDCEWDVKTAEKLSLNDFLKYDLVISARPLYLNRDQEYSSVGLATNLLYSRFSWNRIIYLLVREASSLWHSRLMISQKQTDLKSESVYMLRESRHLGLALGLDSLRYMGIDKDVRSHFDYMFIKAVGIEGLADELKWLYSFFSPSWVQNMKPHEFIIVNRKGPIGVGWCPMVEWHQREGENLLTKLGFKIDYDTDAAKEGLDKGTFSTVGDQEHSEMISLYIQGLGMDAVAIKVNRSGKTVCQHIHKHNRAVERSGFCGPCKRAMNPNWNKLVNRVKG